MIHSTSYSLINWFNTFPTELVWALLLFFSFCSVIFLLKIFGKSGLHLFIIVGCFVVNIQVLKAVYFFYSKEPVALGTIVISCTFLCTDILTELYGANAAKKGIYLGFVSTLLVVIWMLFTLGFKPISPEDPFFKHFGENHIHMLTLFTPAPVLLIASLIAFFLSQLFDVWLFSWLKNLCKGKQLWLRNNLSTIASAFLDSVIFSLLAWIIFASEPLEWTTVWYTYILGTFGMRALIALLDTPVIYIAKLIGK